MDPLNDFWRQQTRRSFFRNTGLAAGRIALAGLLGQGLVRAAGAGAARLANGHLIFKMNALVDRPMIQLLYAASQAGVRVDLLVRGICCLRPGIPDVSENIRVISIVGRFLEHSRIYYFHNNGQEEIFVGSADLMPRNIDHRVEVLFPIESPDLIRHLRDDILEVYLNDTMKARRLMPDGSYERVKAKGNHPPLNGQAWLIGHRAALPAEAET